MSSPRSGSDKLKMMDEKILLEYAPCIRDSNELHEINCYEYLKQIARVLESIKDNDAGYKKQQEDLPGLTIAYSYKLKALNAFIKAFDEAENQAGAVGKYGNIYSKLIKELGSEIAKLKKTNPDEYGKMINDYNNYVILSSFFINPNQSISRAGYMVTTTKMDVPPNNIAETSAFTPTDKQIRERLGTNTGWARSAVLSTKFFSESVLGWKIATTPEFEGSGPGRGLRMASSLAGTSKPQTLTNFPSVKKLRYATYKHELPYEIRMGTQAQIVNMVGRVNPIFEAWIDARRLRSNPTIPARPQLIDEDINRNDDENDKKKGKGIFRANEENQDRPKSFILYINLLHRDSKSTEEKIESDLTNTLESISDDLEKKNGFGIIVITLPADHGLLDKSFLADTSKTKEKKRELEASINTVAKAKHIIFRMLTTDRVDKNEPLHDFYLPDNLKSHIAQQRKSQNFDEFLRDLLGESFAEFGFIDDSTALTPRQFHAAYFHFIKFKLTDAIITALQPEYFMTVCKDGIDRGAAASTYYNLIKSIELSDPISQDEFLHSLHGAAVNVKGRGMNHHIHAIWNAVDCYLAANQDSKLIPDWLRHWHAISTPHATSQDQPHVEPPRPGK